MKKIIETKNLMLHFLKHTERNFILTEDFINFIKYLYVSLSEKGMLDNYLIAYDINLGTIKKSVEYNSDIFSLSLGADIIYVKKAELPKLYFKYPVDSVIENIIKKYVEVYEKKDIKSDKRLKLRK